MRVPGARTSRAPADTIPLGDVWRGFERRAFVRLGAGAARKTWTFSTRCHVIAGDEAAGRRGGCGPQREGLMQVPGLTLSVLQELLAVCRLNADDIVPGWALVGTFCSLTRTADELSIVCPEVNVPHDVVCERAWRGLKVAGPLDFSLTGILSSLAVPLAAANVSIFAVSTFETDYLLVKQGELHKAVSVLRGAGHTVRMPGV